MRSRIDRVDGWKARTLRRQNLVQTTALLLGMLVLVATLAKLLFRELWIAVLLALASLALLAAPRLSPAWLMRLSGAIPLQPHHAPELHRLIARLSREAELERAPRLYWLPRGLLNAFAVGTPDDAAIAVTEGLLRTLYPRELAGVLAHELAHVCSGDMRVMLVAELVARITGSFASAGLLLAFVNFPLVLSGMEGISWWAVLLLVASPSLSLLLQLGLSRSRERAADLDAVRLTGDPRALASALQKIQQHQERSFENLLFRHRHGPESPWLRTHPVTQERIRTLLALEPEPRPRRSEDMLSDDELLQILARLPARGRRVYPIR